MRIFTGPSVRQLETKNKFAREFPEGLCGSAQRPARQLNLRQHALVGRDSVEPAADLRFNQN
jgi:hypothetical protein